MQLFVLGFLTLFQELVLIRYLAGNIWNLGYFPNLVLIAVFVGMGSGFMFHHYWSERTSDRLFQGALVLLLVLVAFVTFANPVVPGFGDNSGRVGDELFFALGPAAGGNSSLMFAVWFALTVLIFVLLSQRTAKQFRRYAPLHAYTLDIAGSCCGILAFMAASWVQLPAFLWFAALIPLYGLALPPGAWRQRAVAAVLLLPVILLARHRDTMLLVNPDFRGDVESHWSPYQKIEYVHSLQYPHHIFVNGIAHQTMSPQISLVKTFYQEPFDDRANVGRAPYKRVMIIGAGSGNDVAAALLNGAEYVHAVEIDPVIYELGRRYHPLRPYDDPRVHVTVTDARVVLTRSSEKYDMIVFALTDSLIKVSPMAQLRLENYLFTTEAAERAFSLLNDGGDLLYYNYYRQPWLPQKISAMILAATGATPRMIFEGEGLTMLKATRETYLPPPPGDAITSIDLPKDDWPFLYLSQRGIPRLYVGAMAVLTVLVALLAATLHRARRGMPAALAGGAGLSLKLAFVLMGVAFLLLETKSVIQFSLLFGTTWVNSSLVFLAVLVLVLAANWTALLLRGRAVLLPIFLLLIGSCAIGLVYPLANLLYFEQPVLRFVLASLLTFSPIFFANLIFSITFRDQEVPEHLFGWNLLGATLGGVAEYASMAVGYTALGIGVALCYTLVFILLVLARRLAAAPPAAPVPA